MPRRKKANARKLRPNYMGQWREHLGFRQEDVADYIGISAGHLSRIERGEKEYMQSIVEAASEYLGLSVATLLEHDPADQESMWRAVRELSEAAARATKKAG